MPVVEARALSLKALAGRCARAKTPLLIRGLLAKPRWRAAAGALGNRSALLAAFGAEEVRLSLGTYLAQVRHRHARGMLPCTTAALPLRTALPPPVAAQGQRRDLSWSRRTCH